jgi:hypothetical protein
VKELDPSMFTKSGIMVGLGEERNEVLQVMDDLRSADVDFLTIGQYLQPTRKHAKVERFVTPEEFEAYARWRCGKGFLLVSSSPLTRSSYQPGSGGVDSSSLENDGSMPTHAEKRLLPYTQEQLFDLVAQVERYPEFLPWCLASRIRRRESDLIVADLVIGFA